MPASRVQISVQWPPAELKKVDAAARKIGLSRCAFIREAALAKAREVKISG